MQEYTKRASCAVTHEVVEALATSNPEILSYQGKPCIERCLFMLGFDVGREDLKVSNYTTRHNLLVRSGANPRMARETTVYSGYVRKLPCGNMHHMYNTYDAVAVLDLPEGIDKGFDSVNIDIQEIG